MRPPAAPAKAESGGPSIVRDVLYGDAANGARNLMDLYLPTYLPAGIVGKAPVVVMLHGGGSETGAPNADMVALCAPVNHVSADDPPFLLVIGSKDRTPQGIADHTRFHEAQRDSRVESTLLITPEAEHGQCFDRELDAILTFLDKHLKK